jgi:hypothetical protein
MRRIPIGLVLAGLVLLASVMVGETINAVRQGRDRILQLQHAQDARPR